MADKTERFAIRLRPAEREGIEKLARENERTASAEVRRAIQRYIATEEARAEP
jgi:hypothetical protein